MGKIGLPYVGEDTAVQEQRCLILPEGVLFLCSFIKFSGHCELFRKKGKKQQKKEKKNNIYTHVRRCS